MKSNLYLFTLILLQRIATIPLWNKTEINNNNNLALGTVMQVSNTEQSSNTC